MENVGSSVLKHPFKNKDKETSVHYLQTVFKHLNIFLSGLFDKVHFLMRNN